MGKSERLYAKSHEWLLDLGDGTFAVGISDHAQSELGDLVFVNLPEVGDQAVAGEPIADVESVKAVSDIYSPATGTVVAINELLLDTPEALNENALENYLFKLSDVTERSELMDLAAYEQYVKEEA
jgi:glycine cleavage system H protein